MAEERAITYIENNSKEDGEAYKTTYDVHKEGICKEDLVDYYSDWARNGKYEKDLCPSRYRGPFIAAEALDGIYGSDREHIRILDVAAGTGRLGEELVKYGFKNIDALDPSQGMLNEAKKKNIYTNLYCEFIDDNRLPINDDEYDAIVVAGGMGEGHIPTIALNEMTRIVKPGGFVCLVMREEYLSYVEDYKNLEQTMKKIESDGKWKLSSRHKVPFYSFNKPGSSSPTSSGVSSASTNMERSCTYVSLEHLPS